MYEKRGKWLQCICDDSPWLKHRGFRARSLVSSRRSLLHNTVLSYYLLRFSHTWHRAAMVILLPSHISKDVTRLNAVSTHLRERFWSIYARAATEFVQLPVCATATILTRRTHCSHPAICACSVSLYKGVGCCSKVCFSMEYCSMVCCSTASVSPYHAACKAHIFTFVVHRRFCCEQTRGHASIGTARCSLDACQPTMQREQLRESRHPRFWRASHFSGCLWYLYCKNQPFLVRYGYC